MQEAVGPAAVPFSEWQRKLCVLMKRAEAMAGQSPPDAQHRAQLATDALTVLWQALTPSTVAASCRLSLALGSPVLATEPLSLALMSAEETTAAWARAGTKSPSVTLPQLVEPKAPAPAAAPEPEPPATKPAQPTVTDWTKGFTESPANGLSVFPPGFEPPMAPGDSIVVPIAEPEPDPEPIANPAAGPWFSSAVVAAVLEVDHTNVPRQRHRLPAGTWGKRGRGFVFNAKAAQIMLAARGNHFSISEVAELLEMAADG